MSIIDLDRRTNYSVYNYSGIGDIKKPIVLYNDHRCLLNVLYEAKQEFGGVHDVFYFDYHDDANDLTTDERKGVIYLGANYLLRDLWDFVEFVSASDDGSWLKAGLELNLINNAIVFGAEEHSNIQTVGPKLYRDMQSRPHLIDCIKDVGDWTERYYCYDRVSGYQKKQVDLINHSSKFVLDFDLDCFSSGIRCVAGGLGIGSTIAVPEVLFKKFVNKTSVKKLLDYLISKANVITICMEPGCCGGFGESYRILYLLDRYLFGGAIGTCPKH